MLKYLQLVKKNLAPNINEPVSWKHWHTKSKCIIFTGTGTLTVHNLQYTATNLNTILGFLHKYPNTSKRLIFFMSLVYCSYFWLKIEMSKNKTLLFLVLYINMYTEHTFEDMIT